MFQDQACEAFYYYYYILLLLLLLNPAAQAQVEKNGIVYKLLTQPHKHLRNEKTEKQTQGSNK